MKFFCNMPVISNHGKAFCKASGFKCTPKVHFVNSHVRFRLVVYVCICMYVYVCIARSKSK